MSCMDMFGSDGGRPTRPQSSTPTSSSQVNNVGARNWGNNKKKGRSSWQREGGNTYWLDFPLPSPSPSQQQLQMAYPHHHRSQYHRYMAMTPPLPPYAPPSPCFGQHSLGFESSSTYTYVSTLPPASSFAPAPAPPFVHFSDDLRNMIVKQIDYYFSDDNLAKDVYLRSKMDDKGWVMVTLIASFRRIAQLTKDIQVILESLRYSTTVEVQSGKLRRRDSWKKWLLLSFQEQ